MSLSVGLPLNFVLIQALRALGVVPVRAVDKF